MNETIWYATVEMCDDGTRWPCDIFDSEKNATEHLEQIGGTDDKGAPVEIIPVVPKSALDAAAARAEQAEAALCEMREVFGEVIDWQGIDHEDENCPEDDTCECKLVARVNAVFKSDSGKSTADELRRLRRFAKSVEWIITNKELDAEVRQECLVALCRTSKAKDESWPHLLKGMDDGTLRN